MKKISFLPFVFVLFAATGVLAQPTLTGASNNPVAGEGFYGFDCDTNGVSVGPSGPGVTWNFSTLASVFLDTALYKACATTPYCDSFPGSSVATFDGMDYFYYITSSSKFALSGIGQSGGSVYFTRPQTYVPYPMTYLTTSVDTFAYNQPSAADYTYGVDSFLADAYGTLTLPSGTYSNVLRIRLIDHATDSSVFGGSPTVTPSWEEVYFWYAPGFHNPLLIITLDTSGNNGIPYLSDVAYYKEFSASVKDVAGNSGPDVRVYPNPTRDDLHVLINANKSESATISFTDLAGRQIGENIASQIQPGENDILCNMADLPAGVYLLKVQYGENTVTQKVVKME